MFAPSFLAGTLIARFGHVPVIAAGLVLLGLCNALAISGTELEQFYLSLVALGLGGSGLASDYAQRGMTSLR